MGTGVSTLCNAGCVLLINFEIEPSYKEVHSSINIQLTELSQANNYVTSVQIQNQDTASPAEALLCPFPVTVPALTQSNHHSDRQGCYVLEFLCSSTP